MKQIKGWPLALGMLWTLYSGSIAASDLGALLPQAHAQLSADRPIKVVVPFAAGNTLDIALRRNHALRPRHQRRMPPPERPISTSTARVNSARWRFSFLRITTPPNPARQA